MNLRSHAVKAQGEQETTIPARRGEVTASRRAYYVRSQVGGEVNHTQSPCPPEGAELHEWYLMRKCRRSILRYRTTGRDHGLETARTASEKNRGLASRGMSSSAGSGVDLARLCRSGLGAWFDQERKERQRWAFGQVQVGMCARYCASAVEDDQRGASEGLRGERARCSQRRRRRGVDFPFGMIT